MISDTPTPENEATAREVVQLGTPPDGFQPVAAFRQPLPMRAFTNLCDALVMAYGDDAKIDPGGNWIGVFGRIPDEEKQDATPFVDRPDKAADFEADPDAHPARKYWWRACEIRPLAPEDGANVYAADHKAAALELVKRHPEVMEYPTIFVWPDGENPTHEGERMNVAAIQTADLPLP